jgi:lysylphosphatidylglycerol synthetase-like protein (DUF2156 family)
MSEPTRGRAARFALPPLLLIAGAYHLLLGAFMVAAPRTFFEEVGPFGAYNGHYVRDIASFYLAMGVMLLLAIGRRSWQVPVLLFCVIQYGFHALNHVWDVSDADPSWLGPINLVVILLIGAGLWWLWRQASAQERARPRREERADAG